MKKVKKNKIGYAKTQIQITRTVYYKMIKGVIFNSSSFIF